MHSLGYRFSTWAYCDKEKSNGDQWNAQPLSHIELHALFELNLYFFEVFNKEAETEYEYEKKPKQESTLLTNIRFKVEQC